jgi:hypothetical protein
MGRRLPTISLLARRHDLAKLVFAIHPCRMDEQTIRPKQDILKLRALLPDDAPSPLDGPADDAYFERLGKRASAGSRTQTT